MIVHVLFFKFDDPAHAAEGKARLEALPATVEVIRKLEAGLNVVESPRAYDLALITEFDSLDDLAAYQSHPDHVAVAGFLKETATSVVAVDYER